LAIARHEFAWRKDGSLSDKSLTQMRDEVLEFCAAHGWYDKPVSFGEAIALLHSEVSEALEAFRIWGLEDGTALQAPEGGHGKPEGVGSEFADVLIRLLDYAARFGVDLDYEYERKMAYNRTRPYRHGDKAL
jgi:NTP pyrophosphatase (non-canonical NTP hydrolase)